jgi:hypothetical protein
MIRSLFYDTIFEIGSQINMRLRKISPLAALVYFALVSILFRYLAYYADNPDTFQYIAIAKKYLHGDWQNAVNGYWSPFISWLLIIPLAITHDSLLAFKILQVLVGFFVIIEWQTLLRNSSVSNRLAILLSFAIIPFVINYALLNLTPDLLFLGITLSLINILIKGNATSDRKTAVKAGVTGGIMFLTKAFGLPLFIALSVAIIYFEKSKTHLNGRSIVALFTPFLFISLLWIVTLSLHYNSFTINKSVSFNRHLTKEMLNGKQELPILAGGINSVLPGQTSAWESPGEYFTRDTKPANFSEIFRRNILSIYYLDFRRQTGILFLLMLAIIILKKKSQIFFQKWLFISLVSIFCFYIGYSFILVHSRYVWINTWLMLLMTSFFISQILTNKYARALSLALLVLLALKRPVKEILFIKDIDTNAITLLSAFTQPIKIFQDTYGADLAIQNFTEEIKKRHIRSAYVYSTGNPVFPRDGYAVSNRIAQSMESVYLGKLESDLPLTPVENAAISTSKFMIDFGNVKSDTASFEKFFLPVLSDNMYGISLYWLKNP